MSEPNTELTAAFDGSDCMGTYSKQDRQCLKYCILRLRCAIEKEQNLRMELIEDLVISDYELGGKLQ